MTTAVAIDYTVTNTHIPAIIRSAESFKQPPGLTHMIAAVRAGTRHISDLDRYGFGSVSSATAIGIESVRSMLSENNLEFDRLSMVRTIVKNASDRSLAEDVDAVTETVDCCYELLSRWGENKLNMADFSTGKNPIHLAALLRVTAEVREQVGNWNSLLGYTIELSKEAGIDPEDALYGLI